MVLESAGYEGETGHDGVEGGPELVEAPSVPRDGMVHLHRHSEYSFLDGLGTAQRYAERARELGQAALAITDHGNLCGALLHVKHCEEQGITPILGMEAYFRPDRTVQQASNRKYFHLVLIARNLEGWRNLMRISSESYESGFYHKPCVDWELLRRWGDGLIGSTSCASGTVPYGILSMDEAFTQESLEGLRGIFGDHLYVEIQPHDWDEQRMLNVELVNLARREGLPIVATTDVHFPEREWHDTAELLLMSRTGQTMATREKAIDEDEPFISISPQSYLMSGDEVRSAFAEHHPGIPATVVDEAVANTSVVAGWIEPFEIDRSPKIPRAASTPEEAERIVMGWCEEGLRRIGKEHDRVYRERLEHERGVLRDKGVFDYFYIIGDLVRWAKDNGIRVGPGRGSAAGCLVSYLSRITAIDPIGHGLLFERFLNPDRVELPDIDIDFQHDRRDEVKQHLAERWGHDRVANVAAFQTFGMASAIQVPAKILGADFVETKRVTDKLKGAVKSADDASDDEGELHLEDVVEHSAPLREYRDGHPDVWRHAVRLEGQTRTMGKHPAGVVITPGPFVDHMPTMHARKGGSLVTAWSERASFPIITTYGFLKIDALSTDSLTIQAHAAGLVRRDKGVDVDFESVEQFPVIADPRDVDSRVMRVYAEGRTLGVFQFESHGITGLLKSIQPDWLGDVTAANALYRPGPMDAKTGGTWEYAKRKHGEIEWSYSTPELAEVLDETHGIIAYQEQVMEIARLLFGFSASEADELRKAMTKWHSNKDNTRRGEQRMRAMEGRAMRHAVEQKGISRADASAVWDQLKAYARYGFNKSHSAGYSLQSYMDAWLKTYHPVEMWTSVLTYEPKKVGRVVRTALAEGVVILPPDVNRSGRGFDVDAGGIRFGLDAIKDVGPTAVLALEAGKPFESFEDLEARVERRKVNAKVKRAMLEAGAFDSWGGRGEWLLDESGARVPGALSLNEMAALEKQRIGFPLSTAKRTASYEQLIGERVHSPSELEGMSKGELVTVGGELVDVRRIRTRKDQEMAFIGLELGGDSYRCTLFPRQYAEANGVLEEGRALLVRGKLDSDLSTVLVEQMITLDDLRSALG